MCDRSLLLASADRFLSKTRFCEHTSCLVWEGGKSRGGQRPHSGPYGSFWVAQGLIVRAHIYSACSFGLLDDLRVPEGFNVDHTCENTLCVSPYHLEVVTKTENNLRQIKPRPNPTYMQLLLAAGEAPF